MVLVLSPAFLWNRFPSYPWKTEIKILKGFVKAFSSYCWGFFFILFSSTMSSRSLWKQSRIPNGSVEHILGNTEKQQRFGTYRGFFSSNMFLRVLAFLLRKCEQSWKKMSIGNVVGRKESWVISLLKREE